MAIAVPSVLAATPEQYSEMLARAESLNRRVHVDICDGVFADATTIGLAQVHVDEGVVMDLHLMLQDPLAQLETALSLHPDLIIFHAEASGDIAGAMAHVHEMGVRAGIALLPSTVADEVHELIVRADHALIFTGHLGHNGGIFQLEQLKKAPQVRAINPDIELSVDGGVTDENASLSIIQGIDVLYVGSFLQAAEDPVAAYAALQSQVGASL